VEFAIISFVLTAMLAGFLGIIVLGLGSFQNNIAAENAGRLLNKVLAYDLADDPDNDLENAKAVFDRLKDETNPLYDEKFLILSPEDYYDSMFKEKLPPINRMLLSSFVYDIDRVKYRYPGAVVTNSDGEETVLIPLLPNADLGATSGIDRANSVAVGSSFPVSSDWVAPVTVAEVEPFDPSVPGKPGYCTLAFFYPSQPGSMVNLDLTRDTNGRIVFQDPVLADDSAVGLGALPSGYNFASPVTPVDGASASRGQYGLGETYAFTVAVRPFRLVFETATTFQFEDPPSQ
jgi:hypothetical protein